ncbi:MAG: hypothetical protein CML13_02355 [Puniceicoccaceae bacterium]|nr:hypothetical protein [Puniceicoccaceae bacterium]
MSTGNDAGSGNNSLYTEPEYASSDVETSDKGFFFWAFQPIAKYAVFSGRARRKEFWGFCLVSGIIGFILGFIEGYLGIAPDVEESVLAGLYWLLILLPSLAVSVRRLHDTNRSGWWVLLSLTGIGYLVLLLFWVQEGSDGVNQYGAATKKPDSVMS